MWKKLRNLVQSAYRSASIYYLVAYRNHAEGGQEPFITIQNPAGKWCADPFVFKYHDEYYIFAEILDLERGYGSIGYYKIPERGERSSWHEAIVEPYHMSYPFIWEDQQGIHICPETGTGTKDVHVYNCVQFPEQWVQGRTFVQGKNYADSTILFDEDKNPLYLFTHEWTGPLQGKLYRYTFERESDTWGIKEGSELFLTADPQVNRPGGDFLYQDKKVVRVAQDGSLDYGKKLVFLEIKSENPYAEEIVRQVSYDCFNRDKNCIGMHTFNQVDDVQVVDFRMKKFHADVFARIIFHRVCQFISKRMGKVKH